VSLNGYGQVAATIFTLSTFSFGALAADAAGGCVAERLGGSTVPMISTLWPTCDVSFASSASRRYSLATAVLDGDPAVPAVLPLGLIAALVSTNFDSLDAGLVLPLVPVGADFASCTQPVTVIALSAPLDADGDGGCDGDELGGFCARAAAVTPNTIAAHVTDQNRIFIRASCA